MTATPPPGRYAPAPRDGLLFDPNTYDPQEFDAETRRLLRATIDFFEGQGKKRILDDDLKAQWPADFVEFVKREKLFATFLTPSEFADGNPDKRWDGARNAALAEILGFYGLTYWYTEQVTILGLGPVWQSENKDAKLRAADDLEAGEVMAFGLSEREHGADVYSTDMVLTPASEEDQAVGILYRASGEKYYIGNGNVASLVSVFGRRGDVEGHEGLLRLLRRRQQARELPPDRQRRAHADLREHVPAGELPGAGRGHPAHRRGSLQRRAQYGQRRQVQPVLVVDRHVRARLLRGDHPRPEPHPLRQPGDRLRPRPGQLRRRVRTDDRDEGVQQARHRLLPQRQPRGPPLPAVQPDDQGQGHHGGRDGRCAPCTTSSPQRVTRRTPCSARSPS